MIKVFYNMLAIFLGSLIVAMSITLFIIPYKFVSGGIAGMSLIIYYLTDIRISLLIYLLNIPIVALGAKYVGKTFAMYSVAGITMMSSFIFLLNIYKINFPPLTSSPLLAAIFAGVTTGLGGGIVFKSGGTLGGTDILGVIAKKRYGISIGNFLFYSNVVIMAVSLIFFSPEIVMYTLISMYVASSVTDKIQEGINVKTTVIIISNYYDQIAQNIINSLNRGVTFLNAEGGFLHNEKKVILCVITRFQLSKLKDITLQTDPAAFISISETKEVLGKGF